MVSIFSAIAATAGMLIDNIIAGQLLGQNALASMGIVSAVSLVFSAVGNICTGGGTVLAAQAIGKGDNARVKNIFTLTMGLALISGFVLTLPGLLFPREIAIFLGAKDSLLDMSAAYIQGYFLGGISIIAMTPLMGFVRIDGSLKMPLYAILVMSVCDVLLDFLLVAVFKQGMFGMAIATTLSYILAVLTTCLHFFKKRNTLGILKPQSPWRQLGEIIVTGAPTAVSRLCECARSIVLNVLAISVVGVGAVAALNVRNQAYNIIGALTFGVAQAIIPVVGMFFGEGDKHAQKATLKSAIVFGLILNMVAAVLLIVFPCAFPIILGVKDEAIMNMAVMAMVFFAISAPDRCADRFFLP